MSEHPEKPDSVEMTTPNANTAVAEFKKNSLSQLFDKAILGSAAALVALFVQNMIDERTKINELIRQNISQVATVRSTTLKQERDSLLKSISDLVGAMASHNFRDPKPIYAATAAAEAALWKADSTFKAFGYDINMAQLDKSVHLTAQQLFLYFSDRNTDDKNILIKLDRDWEKFQRDHAKEIQHNLVSVLSQIQEALLKAVNDDLSDAMRNSTAYPPILK
jgi:hypothetical protein